VGAIEPGRFETFDANERFVVVRDERGYGVWRMEDLEEGNPIERFPDDDGGYEAAAKRWREFTRRDREERGVWLNRLLVVLLVALGLWVAASAVPIVQFVFVEEDVPFPGNPGEPQWERILYAVSAVSFDLWVASAVAYVVVWMNRRGRTGFVSTGTDPG
jgi:hypothetical protein